MKIGAAKVSITPYFAKVWLAGFANPKRKFLGAHDEGWARAMYIEDGQEKICFVSIDNLGFDSSRLADMAPEIAEKTGLSIDNILFNATHTHSMPAAERRKKLTNDYNEEYADWMYKNIVEAICLACNNAEEGYLEYGFTTCKGVSINRRRLENGVSLDMLPDPDGLNRDEVFVLRAICGEKTKAILTKFTCHASTVGLNYSSGDWPGYACRGVEASNPGAVALFMQGCCGSIRPCLVEDPDHMSTTTFREAGFEDIMNIGKAVSTAAQGVLDGEMTPVKGKIAAKKIFFDLPFQPPLPIEEYADSPSDPFLIPIYKKYMRDNYNNLPTSMPYSMQRIDLGDTLTVIGMEGEVVVDYEYHMDKIFSDRRVVTAGYSNGLPCYICTAKMLDEGGYESIISMNYYIKPVFKPEVEQTIIDNAKRLK